MMVGGESWLLCDDVKLLYSSDWLSTSHALRLSQLGSRAKDLSTARTETFQNTLRTSDDASVVGNAGFRMKTPASGLGIIDVALWTILT